MTTHKLLTQDQFITMPWKNGKGETLELLRIEDDQGIAFRISQAKVVEPGEFSDFSGLERHLVLIEGKGIHLEHPKNPAIKQQKLLQLLDIARFDGGDPTFATLLNGPITDLNIMTRKKDRSAEVSPAYSPAPLPNTSQNTKNAQCYFYANQDALIAVENKTENITMTKNSLLTLSASESYTLSSGNGVLISLHSTEE